MLKPNQFQFFTTCLDSLLAEIVKTFVIDKFANEIIKESVVEPSKANNNERLNQFIFEHVIFYRDYLQYVLEFRFQIEVLVGHFGVRKTLKVIS